MANITILLREEIDNLGGRGDIVKVKAGYARNYLLPHRLASLASKGNVKQIEQERAALLKRAAVDRETAEAQRDQMASISLNFERKAGDHGTLFGSVTSMDVAEALQAKGYEIDRRKIVLKDAIKETGEYTVNVKLYRDVILSLPVIVTAEGGEAEAKPERKAKKEAKPATDEANAETPTNETVVEEAAPASEESVAEEPAATDEKAAE